MEDSKTILNLFGGCCVLPVLIICVINIIQIAVRGDSWDRPFWRK